MLRFRTQLPQLDDRLFIAHAGLELVMMFHERFELPHMAAFVLLKDTRARQAMRRYFDGFAEIARNAGAGLIVDGPTWRASPDWGAKIGYSPAELAQANRDSLELQRRIRDAHQLDVVPIVLSAAIGPRGDGYVAGARMTPAEAEAYHAFQIRIFAETEADMVTAYTINYVEEAVGIARAARAARIPCAISFTLETDGKLPSGQSLGEAIAAVDAATDAAPAYYMINCAHASHFDQVLSADAPWIGRLRGLQGNASKKSHAELDASTTLDEGNPVEFGVEKAALHRRLPHINILGGCCGTDHRHIEQVAQALRPAA
jgi:S-methylmethionine-dependent homocysteine/selenocysteine methylase